MLYQFFKLGILYFCIFNVKVVNVLAKPHHPYSNEQSVRITRSVMPSLENAFANANTGVLGNNNLQSTFTDSASTSILIPPISNAFATSQGSETANLATSQGSETANLATSQGSETANLATSQGSETANFATSQGSETANFATDDINPSIFDVSQSSSTSTSSLLHSIPSNNDYLNVFAKSVLSSPAMAKYLNVEMSGPEASTTLFNIAYRILNGLGDPNAFTLATLVGQKAAPYKVFTVPLHFDATGNTIEKFLIFDGTEIVPSLAESYANIIGKSIETTNVIDSYSLYNAILNGFVTFIQSLGYDFDEKVEMLTYIFNTELGALQNSGIY